MKYNNTIDYGKIDCRDVAIKLGIKATTTNFKDKTAVPFHCFTSHHKNGDKNASLSIYDNGYTCGCGIHGNTTDLIQEYNKCNGTEAKQWLVDNFAHATNNHTTNGIKTRPTKPVATIKPTNQQVRWVEVPPTDKDGKYTKTIFVKTANIHDIRTPNESDLQTIQDTINKNYTPEAFQAGGVKFSDNISWYNTIKTGIVMQIKPANNIYTTKCVNTQSVVGIVVEGITDYLTALSMNLHQDFHVLARFNKSTKLVDIDTNIKKLFVISDTDETADQLIKVISGTVKAECEIHQFKFDMIPENDCKDLSDYWQLMNSTEKATKADIDTLIETIKDTAVKIDFGIDYCFWNDNKNHSIDIIKLYAEFERRGFALVKDNIEPESTIYDMVKINNNVIEPADTSTLCHYAIHNIAKTEIQQYDTNIANDIQEQFMTKQALFTSQAKNALPRMDIDTLRDDKNTKRLCLKNSVLQLKTDGSLKNIEYNELPRPVYKSEIIKHDIDTQQVIDTFKYYKTNNSYINDNLSTSEHATPFANFIKDVCTNKAKKLDTPRLKALISVFGYMCIDRHETVAKIIVMTENNTDGLKQGGTGKSLLANAISHVQKSIIVNAKGLNQKSDFKYQQVTKNTRNLVFEDIEPKFDFTSLYNIPTEGITVNKKFIPEFTLAGNNAPKLLLTTNDAIQDFGDESTARRRFDMELYKCYTNKDTHKDIPKDTPETRYGTFFKDDWKRLDWSKYYGFVLYCVWFYMNNGLCEYESKTKVYRQLQLLTDTDGIDCLEAILRDMATQLWNESFGENYEVQIYQKDKERIRKDLIEATESNLNTLSKEKVLKIIRKFCEFKKIELIEDKRKSNTRFWELKGTKQAFSIT